MDDKFKSRKFLMALAAFLASLGAGISGLIVGNEALSLAGGILCVVSAAIYAFCEAYVDAASVKSETASYEEKVTVQSVNKSDRLSKAAADKMSPSTSTSSTTTDTTTSEV